MQSNEVKEKLQALLIAYTKNLPIKMGEIENLWDKLREHWDAAEFQDFHREVHSLSGSAGTYGYVELGKSARQLEIYLKALLDKSQLSVEQQHTISQLLAQLKASFLQIIPKQLESVQHSKNDNVVFILDKDTRLVREIQKYSKESSYRIRCFPDFLSLITALKDQLPAILILDVECISDEDIPIFNNYLTKQRMPASIFCTAVKGDILTRLRAIRMGGQVFFQKPIDPFFLARALDQECGISSTRPYRILIIDDSEALAEYYALTLGEAGMITHYITNPLCFLEMINEFQPDLILMDIYMPECTGLELAAVLRQESQYTRIPIIFLSTEDDRLKQLSALSLGGDDFLTKPILPQHLIEAVRSRAKRADELNYFMTRDSLTGLLNHTNILQRLEIEFARAERESTPMSFVMIDIDLFKKVNDTYGHLIGDKVLKTLSALLTSSLRRTDVAGRYGGEEFALILPNTNAKGSLAVCNALREEFSKIPHKVNRSIFYSTFSAGISTFSPDYSVKDMITYADEALYIAKHNGRNQIVCYEESR